MSTIEELRTDIADSRTRLLTFSAAAKERAKLGRMNEDKAKEAKEQVEKNTQLLNTLRECVNHMISIYKNIEKYASDRKELSLSRLKVAIESAGYIVPDAATQGIHLEIDGKKARIVNGTGMDMNLREGSAYRTVMGVLIRYTLLKAQPDALQALWLDEMFNTLSDETAVMMREYLNEFIKDILIVGIEQRDTLFQGVEKAAVYRAKKNVDGYTDVILEESFKSEVEDSNEFDML